MSTARIALALALLLPAAAGCDDRADEPRRFSLGAPAPPGEVGARGFGHGGRGGAGGAPPGVGGAGGDGSLICNDAGSCALCQLCAVEGPCAALASGCEDAPACLFILDCLSSCHAVCAGAIECLQPCTVNCNDGSADFLAATALLDCACASACNVACAGDDLNACEAAF